MSLLHVIFNIFEIILFVYLGFAAVYILFFSLAGLMPYRPKSADQQFNRKIAVLIPGYKEDLVILDAASQALNQFYPPDNYDVVVVADSFQPATLIELSKLPVKVIEVSFEKSTKSKALNAAMEVIGDDYEIAVILDADNIMAPDFLDRVNRSVGSGFLAVQGHRVAKNMNTTMALLDSVSEEINNHVFRKGHRAVGLSSALIGSGMAFRYDFFKRRMAAIKAIGGFDKELELTMLRDRIRIEYLENAYVFDEKVQKQAVFENQRRRWLSAQFVYFQRFAWDGIVQFIARFNIDYLDKVYQMIQPPRILLLGILTLITLIVGFFSLVNYLPTWEFLAVDFMMWFTIWSFTVIAMGCAVPRKFYTKRTFVAVLSLPWGFWLMIRSLVKTKGANKSFIHTQHGVPDNKE
ncbi:MAG: hypothetical protein A2X22_04295 [Bacteroidetes bacterium GWF2_49_14]|nr:MAG: hypothetical protein A2X22_04295 [Bacteroidetes bacterium GWF2_49_14]